MPETTSDPTEAIRRDLLARGVPEEALTAIIASGGQIWDTQQLQTEFTVQGFLAPFVGVTRKADGVKGAMMFTHNPRFYFDFVPSA